MITWTGEAGGHGTTGQVVRLLDGRVLGGHNISFIAWLPGGVGPGALLDRHVSADEQEELLETGVHGADTGTAGRVGARVSEAVMVVVPGQGGEAWVPVVSEQSFRGAAGRDRTPS